MHCSERDRIAEKFAEAVKAYSEAVNRLRTLRGHSFTQHEQLVEQARLTCEAARKRLQNHEREHGCS